MRQIINPIFLSIGILFLTTACGNVKSENRNQEIKEEKMDNSKFNNAPPEQLDGINKALEAYINAAIKGDSKIE